MKKVLTAIGNPVLNDELRKDKQLKIMGNDIQYQEGIIEFLENEKNIDFLIISETIPGEYKIEKIINEIIKINNEIKIIIILENKNEELEKYLNLNKIYSILYNNKIEINEIIDLIKNKTETENEKIKKEINELKQIIINQNNFNIKNKENKIKNKIKNKIQEIIKNKKNINNNYYTKKENNNKEVISILGSSGVGKSIFSVNFAKSLIHSKNKILIIDFDILNNSLHTILGLKKYPEKIRKKIKNNDLIKNKLKVKDLIIRINKKIDLISGINLLFDSKYKISSVKIKNILEELKKYYDVIIIDTSSECFLDYTKEIIKNSNINIFIIEPNLLEIKKSNNLLEIYTKEWDIKKERINILFNKFNNNSVDINILKCVFKEYNIIGKIKINDKYNLIINKNTNKTNKKIKKEYIQISNKILKNKNNKKYKINNVINDLFNKKEKI